MRKAHVVTKHDMDTNPSECQRWNKCSLDNRPLTADDIAAVMGNAWIIVCHLIGLGVAIIKCSLDATLVSTMGCNLVQILYLDLTSLSVRVGNAIYAGNVIAVTDNEYTI